MAGVLLASLLFLAPDRATASAMQTYVSAMQPGWNLGNALDAVPTETSWGNPRVTPEFIQQIAAQGFKGIRIPVTWTHHLGAAPDYAVDPAWMDRVQEIVDWSLDAGLYVGVGERHATRLADLNLIATSHYYGFWPFSVNTAGRTVAYRFSGASTHGS